MSGLDTFLDDMIPSAALVIARCFAANATMWCVSPRWPEHGHHLAVEFVHPVIMGTRALPAVAVDSPSPIAALRVVVRPGDVVVALSPADDPDVGDLLRRASTWGATTIWLATGSGGEDTRSDVTIRIDDPDGTAPHDGRLVLRYHLLWELTHVCFEHPGLLTPAPVVCADGCVTCSDEGRLGEVVTTDRGGSDVEVRTAEGREQVDGSLVEGLVADDLVLIHAGSIIARVTAP